MTLFRVPSWLLAAVFLLAQSLVAQAVVVQWNGPDGGDWNNEAHWPPVGDPSGFAPDVNFDEAGAINNNTTAVLSARTQSEGNPTDVGGLILGQTAGNFGGLRITNGGSMANFASFTETGAIVVGQAGTGVLTVLGGGTISGTSLSLGGGSGSSIRMGDATNLTATLTTDGNATLNRTVEVTGRFVDFNVGGNMFLGAASTLVPRINHASQHSTLRAAGTATVNGTLRPEFDGITPTIGDTWNLIDAATINGNFTQIDASAAPALASGQAFQVVHASGGTHGQLLQLTVSQVLTLEVHRTTGAVTIRNAAAAGTSPIPFDGYSIISSLGSLTGVWNSLQDQAVSGWQETGVHPTDLSELHPTGSLTLVGGESRSMGTPYIPAFPAFGVDPDDLRFEYSTPDGKIFDGSVEYVGPKVHNNLVVTVNPATGQAQLKNDSPFSVSIDGYQISSASGELRPANWSSLADQGVPGWDEAAPDEFFLSELNPDGDLVLSPGQTFALGAPFNPGGTQDLQFRFLIAGGEGDFNNDGVIDAADYTVWRDGLGSAFTLAQFDAWKTNFGGSGGADDAVDGVLLYGTISGSAALAAVPEPASLLMFVGVAVGLCCRRCRRESICGIDHSS